MYNICELRGNVNLATSHSSILWLIKVNLCTWFAISPNMLLIFSSFATTYLKLKVYVLIKNIEITHEFFIEEIHSLFSNGVWISNNNQFSNTAILIWNTVWIPWKVTWRGENVANITFSLVLWDHCKYTQFVSISHIFHFHMNAIITVTRSLWLSRTKFPWKNEEDPNRILNSS